MGGRKSYTVADRQTSVQIQQSAYGGPVPVLYGTNRIAGNMVFQANFKAIAKTTTTSSGGKGFGGGGSSDTNYTYTVSAILALCEGPIASVGTVWKDSATTTLAALNLTLFTGTATQAVWSFLSGYSTSTTYAADAQIGYQNYTTVPAFVSQAINYSSTAYLASPAYDLADAAAVPNHNFEVTGLLAIGGGNADANPAAIIPDMLTSQQYGMGFNSGWIGSLTSYSTYCQALGLFVSPAYIAQRPGTDVLQELTEATNAAVLWSGGVLNIIPYGDATISGNGATFTPDLTPLYDLGDDDFLPGDGGGPIKISRSTPADAYNRIAVQFKNRANQYNQEIAYAEDQDAIEKYGLKIASTITMDFVCVPSIAKQMTQLALQRLLYKRNTYEFPLNARFPMLEPMDIVTLTDPGLGLAKLPVRIVGIEEIDDGFQVTAEDLNAGVSQAATYAHDSGVRWTTAIEIPASSPAAPIIFELPGDPSTTGLAVAIAAGAQSGDLAYGGCNVWLSLDGTNYRQEGTIYGSSRYGTLTASLPASAAGSDTTNTARLSLRSGGQMLSGSAADVAKGTTLMVCGTEFFAYQTATLTGTNAYDLTTLNRGLFGSTSGTHAPGATWARADGAIATLADLDLALIGQSIFIKLTAFNIYGQNEQGLSVATAYTYTITGWAQALSRFQAALNDIAAITSDSVLSRGSEKQRTNLDYQAILTDLSALNARYVTLGSPADLTTVKGDADTAVTALTTYLTGLSPSWTDPLTDTPIVATTFVAKFTDAYAKLSLFRAAITGRTGSSQRSIYIRQLAPPATPTGNSPSGWSFTGIPSGTDTIWQSTGSFDAGMNLIGVWPTPRAVSTNAPAGTYNAGTTYYLTNNVGYGGGTYSALQDAFSGQAPSGTSAANAYWSVISAPGSVGAPATPPGAFSATIALTSGAAVNLRALADAAGYTGYSNATITFNVPSGVTIRGLSGGGIGIDTGSWPTGSYTIALTLVVQSGGIVDGGGGDGGDSSYGAGGAGGDAIYCRVPLSGGITINSGGTVRGGGGGGEAGYGVTVSGGSGPTFGDPFYGGGGGGGGRPNGGGGLGEASSGGGSGSNGTAGTTTTAGTGGAGDAGTGAAGSSGGTFAAAGGGGSGGAAGYAVRKNGNTVTVTNSGTMTGTAA